MWQQKTKTQSERIKFNYEISLAKHTRRIVYIIIRAIRWVADESISRTRVVAERLAGSKGRGQVSRT